VLACGGVLEAWECRAPAARLWPWLPLKARAGRLAATELMKEGVQSEHLVLDPLDLGSRQPTPISSLHTTVLSICAV